MAFSATNMNIAGTGKVYVAPLATTAPATATAAPAAGWVDLGYCSEAGVTFHVGVTSIEVKAWQAFYPVRRVITERDANLKFTMLELTADSLKLAFGGGTVATGFSPALEGTVDSRALMVDWTDGSIVNRIVVPNGIVTDLDDINLTKSGPTDLGVTFSVLGTDGTPPWYLLSNATALV